MAGVVKKCDVQGCLNTTTKNKKMMFITLPPDRRGHSKWLSKTFGNIGLDDPNCQTVCEEHADPQFLRMIKSQQPGGNNSTPGPSHKKKPGRKPKSSPATTKRKPKLVKTLELVPVAGALASKKQETQDSLVKNMPVTRAAKHSKAMTDKVPVKRARLGDIPQTDEASSSSEVIIKEEVIIKVEPENFEGEPLPHTYEGIKVKQEIPDTEVIETEESFAFDVEIKKEPDTDYVLEIEPTKNIDDIPIKMEANLMAIKEETQENFTNKVDFHSIDALLTDLVQKKLITNSSEKNILSAHKLQFQSLQDNCTTVLNPTIKSFAITLYVSSHRAYDYVRNSYHIPLPPPSTIRNLLIQTWGQSGFTRETLKAISAKANAIKQLKPLHKIYVCLDLNDVQMKESAAFQGPNLRPRQTTINPLDWSANTATAALVLSAVALNADWKLPIGYFWNNIATGSERANLVQAAISILEKVGVEPVAVAFDYSNDNLQMCKDLNCCIDKINLKTSFMSESGKVISLFPDPRGVLEEMYTDFKFMGSFVDDNQKVVNLNQILLLLRNVHVVKGTELALRKFIASEVCKNQYSSDPEAVSGAVRFFKNIHVVLDVLFSRKGCVNLKKPVSQFANMAKNPAVQALRDAAKYFKGLTSKDSAQSLWETSMGRFILGLCALIDSALTLIQKHSNQLCIQFGKFIGGTYFLANLGPQGQYRKYPTPRTFQKEYQTMLQDIGPLRWSKGKSFAIENLALLTCNITIDRINITTNLPNGTRTVKVVDDLKNLLRCKMAEFEDMIVIYIARFVTYSLVSRLSCEICIRGLRLKHGKGLAKEEKGKTRFAVKLEEPSADALNICKTTEAAFQKAVRHNGTANLKPNMISFLLNKLLKKYVGRPLFESIAYHQFDTDRTCNHLIELAKAVAELYLETRMKNIRN